jgi:hypothetical protein
LLEPDALKGARPVLRRARAQQCARAYPTNARAISQVSRRWLRRRSPSGDLVLAGIADRFETFASSIEFAGANR